MNMTSFQHYVRGLFACAGVAVGLSVCARTIPASVRTISVGATNPGKGVVQLAFGDAPQGDATPHHLFAVRAAVDPGATVDGWDETRYLGEVPSSLNAQTIRLPVDWFTSVSRVRFVLGTQPFARQAKYLTSANQNQWFETGHRPTKDTETTITCLAPAARAGFGVAGWHLAFHNGTTGFAWSHFGNVVPTNFHQDWYNHDEVHTWRLGPDGMIVDGHVLQGPYATFQEGTCPQTMPIFGRKNATTGEIEKYGAIRVGRVQIREKGVLVRDYIPCQSETGVSGFYDTVNDTFAGSAGSQPLSVGEADWGSVPTFGVFKTASVSDAVTFGDRSFEVTAFDAATGAVTLSFGAGAAKQLYAVHDATDRGRDWLDWKENACLGDVAADATTGTFALPAAWRTVRGTVRFVLADTDALPDGYTRIEYVGSQNNANQTVDTGVYPDNKTAIRLVTKVGESPCSFGVTSGLTSDVPGGYLVFVNGGGGIFTAFPGVASAPSIAGAKYPELGAKHVIDFGPDGVKIAGKRYFDPFVSTTDAPLTTTMTLMKRHGGSNEKTGWVNVYSAYIERDGIALRSFVPAVKDGTYGLYDYVTKRLYADSGVPLAHGAATTDHELLPHTGKSVSPAFNIGPTISVTSFDSHTGALSVTFSGAVGRGELYLVGAVEDLGTLPSAWTDTYRLATLASDATSWLGTVPADFLGRTHKTMRLFFVADTDKPFDQEVAWISGYGFQFETGYRPDCQTQTEIEQGTASDCSPIGIKDYHQIRNWTGGHIYVDHFGHKEDVLFSARTLEPLHAYSFGPDGVLIDGTLKAGPYLSFTSWQTPKDYTLRLAGSRDSETANVIHYQGTQYIGKCRMRHNGSVVRDFVPCLKDGVPGFWDYQRQVFAPNIIAGKTVTAGPAVIVPLTDATFGSCSAPFLRQIGLLVIVK